MGQVETSRPDAPESPRGGRTSATRSVLARLGTIIFRTADCLLERLSRLCDVHDDPVPDMATNVQVLYRGYVSRARRIRGAAHFFLVLTFLMYSALFSGVIYTALNYRDFATVDVVESLEIAERTDPAPDLNDVVRSSLQTEVVVAVGNDGAVAVSGDGGKSWEQVESGTRHDLYSVAFSPDGRTAIASGDSGTVLLSMDFGRSWDVKESGTRKDLNKIVLDEDGASSIAAGDDGRILVSSDGGTNWNELNDVTPEAKDLNGLALSRDGRDAVVVGDDRTIMISYSNDGSHHGDRGNWSSKSVDIDDPRADFNAVAFGSGGKGFVVGDDESIIEISHKGNKLDLVQKHITREGTNAATKPKGMDFQAVAFSGDGKTAIAVGGRRNRGSIGAYRDSNDGKDASWYEGASHIGDRLDAVALDDDGNRAVAVGRDGAILVSTDHGKEWHSRDAATANDLHAVTLDKKGVVAIVVGEKGTILRSESARNEIFPEFESVTPFEDAPPPESITPRRQDSNSVPEETVFFTALVYRNVVLIGPILVLIFVIRYLIVLTRYTLRLAAFYDARGDAILFSLPPEESADISHRPGDGGGDSSQSQPSRKKADFPRPKDIGELERLMRAVSPDDLDFGRTPKTTIEEVARLAKVMVGRGKKG